MTVHALLLQLRGEMTQDGFAKYLGVNLGTYQKWEQGKRAMTVTDELCEKLVPLIKGHAIPPPLPVAPVPVPTGALAVLKKIRAVLDQAIRKFEK